MIRFYDVKKHVWAVVKVIIFILGSFAIFCLIGGGIILLVFNSRVSEEKSCLILTESDFDEVKDDWYTAIDTGSAVKDTVKEKNADFLYKDEPYYYVFTYSGFIGLSFSAYSPDGFINFNNSALNVLETQAEIHEIKRDAKDYLFRAYDKGDVNGIEVDCDYDNNTNTVSFKADTEVVLIKMRVAVKFMPTDNGVLDASSQMEFVSDKKTVSSEAENKTVNVTYNKIAQISDITTRYASAQDCPNGDIKEEFLTDTAEFSKGQTYYAVTTFNLQVMRDNDGTGILEATFEINNPIFNCSLSEASSGDTETVTDGDGTRITLYVKLPPLVSEVKTVRVVIKIVPEYECVGFYSLSFGGEDMTCLPEKGTPEYWNCMPR